jgi:hypothetical protein
MMIAVGTIGRIGTVTFLIHFMDIVEAQSYDDEKARSLHAWNWENFTIFV